MEGTYEKEGGEKDRNEGKKRGWEEGGNEWGKKRKRK